MDKIIENIEKGIANGKAKAEANSNQTVFTPESLKSPMLKDEFDSYEGRQEAGKFGIKNKRRDDI